MMRISKLNISRTGKESGSSDIFVIKCKIFYVNIPKTGIESETLYYFKG